MATETGWGSKKRSRAKIEPKLVKTKRLERVKY